MCSGTKPFCPLITGMELPRPSGSWARRRASGSAVHGRQLEVSGYGTESSDPFGADCKEESRGKGGDEAELHGILPAPPTVESDNDTRARSRKRTWYTVDMYDNDPEDSPDFNPEDYCESIGRTFHDMPQDFQDRHRERFWEIRNARRLRESREVWASRGYAS